MPQRPRPPSDSSHRAPKQAAKIAHFDELVGPMPTSTLTPENKKRIARKTPVNPWEKGKERGRGNLPPAGH
jgi:hypothetical protein